MSVPISRRSFVSFALIALGGRDSTRHIGTGLSCPTCVSCRHRFYDQIAFDDIRIFCNNLETKGLTPPIGYISDEVAKAWGCAFYEARCWEGIQDVVLHGEVDCRK